jgi:hypothetical protein
MRPLRTKPQSNKTNHLPAGISCTWRKRKGKRPYFEYQVYWSTRRGIPKIKNFYVGVDPTPIRMRLMLLKAIAFRRAYELNRLQSRRKSR